MDIVLHMCYAVVVFLEGFSYCVHCLFISYWICHGKNIKGKRSNIFTLFFCVCVVDNPKKNFFIHLDLILEFLICSQTTPNKLSQSSTFQTLTLTLRPNPPPATTVRIAASVNNYLSSLAPQPFPSSTISHLLASIPIFCHLPLALLHHLVNNCGVG